MIYLLIGVAVYYIVGVDDDPALMNDIHRIAPGVIIGVVILLIIVRNIVRKQKKDGE